MMELITFFGTLWGRVAVAGGIFATLLAAWVGFAWHFENKGAAQAVAKIEQRNNANVEKAQAARRSVQGIPDDQLDDQYRRD
jgi:hypothetical protein